MLRHPLIAGLVMLALTAGVLVLFIGSLVVLGLADTEIVPAWVLLLFFGFAAITAWFILGRALPAGFGFKLFGIMSIIGVVPILLWSLYQFALFADGGEAAVAGGHIGGAILAAMAATAGPITVGLGYISRKEE